MFDLHGKCALVTGASGGIGSAISRALYAQGAKIVLSGRKKENLNSLTTELGNNAYAIEADLSNPANFNKFISDTETAMGSLDILVNNAGLTKDNLSIRMKNDDWQTVLDINLTASFFLARACLRGMIKRKSGRIINITSVVGVTGNPGQTNYAASKAGVIGYTKSLAQEVASRNITVNCIAPGFVATAMTDTLKEKQRKAALDIIPVGRIGKAEEIAAGVVFLASNEAAYITGQTLHINGGIAMI